MNLKKLNINNFLSNVFLLCFAILPLLSLLWQSEFYFIKGNWLLYPIILIAIIFSVIQRNKIPKLLPFWVMLFIAYVIIFILNNGDFENIIRPFFTFLPLLFLDQIRKFQTKRIKNIFFAVYSVSILVPIYFSYLQFIGQLPYYEFDAIDGESVGRISGGYNKPNNFIAIIFPFYMYGFYNFLSNRRTIGLLIIVLSLFLVFATGLRVAEIISLVILLGLFQMKLICRFVYYYYKFHLNFILPVIGMIALYIIYYHFGFIDGLRGRIPMWEAHSYEFFNNSNIPQFIFGKGKVLLPINYERNRLIGSIAEAHNNSFRTIVTFGIFGHLIYCLTMRWVALKISNLQTAYKMKFIYASCFIFLILYSITNEPAYYSSIFWSITIWLFLNIEEETLVEV